MGGRGGAEQNKGDKGGYGGAMRDIAGGMGGNGGTEEDKGGNGGHSPTAGDNKQGWVTDGLMGAVSILGWVTKVGRVTEGRGAVTEGCGAVTEGCGAVPVLAHPLPPQQQTPHPPRGAPTAAAPPGGDSGGQ